MVPTRMWQYEMDEEAHPNGNIPFHWLLPVISARETLIKSLSDFILGFLYRARNHLTRIASYLRKMMTKLCIKIHIKSDSAI